MSLLNTLRNLEDNPSVIKQGEITYTNNSNLPYETMLFIISQQRYDGAPTTADNLSVSDLMMPMRKLLLKIQKTSKKEVLDVSTLTKSAKGTALHTAYEEALRSHGYIQEVRNETNILGVTLSGKFDMITPHSVIKDLKHCSSFSLASLKREMVIIRNLPKPPTIQECYEKYPFYFKYTAQLSLYRMLNQETVKHNHGYTIFVLNDGGNFGQLPVDSEVKLPLFSVKETEEWATNRIAQMKQHLVDGTLPDCSPIERGETPAEYKIQRLNSKNKWTTIRGTKTNSLKEAQAYLLSEKSKSTDKLHKTPETYKLCEFCNVRSLCEGKEGNE